MTLGYETLEKTKLIYGDGRQIRGCLGPGTGLGE